MPWFSRRPNTLIRYGAGIITPPGYPAPSMSVWNFDHTAVTSWDTDVVASSTSALTSAMRNAMIAGTGNHRITTTFTSVAGDYVAFIGEGVPSIDTNILVQPETMCEFNGELRLNGPSNCKFVGYTMQPIGSSSQCVENLRGGVRLAFEDNLMGHFWAGLSNPADYPTAFSGTSNGTQIYSKNNEYRRIREVLDGRDGLHHFEDDIVSEYIDDSFAGTVRNGSSHICYIYTAGVVVTDPVDDPSFSGLHPDYAQTGHPGDTALDEYLVESHQSIYLGGTVQQYPSQGIFMSLDTGSAKGARLVATNMVLLTTGQRGITLSDRRSSVTGCLLAKPPTGVRVPTGGDFPGILQVQELRTGGDAVDGVGATPVMDGVLFGQFVDAGGWGVSPVNTTVADHLEPLGNPTSYDVVFPNMAGLTYDTDQVVIPAYSGDRTIAAVRAYVAEQYEPADGWGSIGMVTPAIFGPA